MKLSSMVNVVLEHFQAFTIQNESYWNGKFNELWVLSTIVLKKLFSCSKSAHGNLVNILWFIEKFIQVSLPFILKF